MMKKKMKKTLSVVLCTVFTMSMAGTSFASVVDPWDLPTSEYHSATARGTIENDEYGGTLEWGIGAFNFWGRYQNVNYDHQVILWTDNSAHYGAWELGGQYAYPSYKEVTKGKSNKAEGNIRF